MVVVKKIIIIGFVIDFGYGITREIIADGGD